jgi:predicted dienelactone hydrolase
MQDQQQQSVSGAAPGAGEYDPFVRGSLPVGVRTIEAFDKARDRLFPCEIWYPATAQHAGQDLDPQTQYLYWTPTSSTPRSQMAVRNATAAAGTYPLVIFSHFSGGSRQSATYLCTHLSSHGYVVAALDHSELVAAESRPQDGETAEQRAARAQVWIENRPLDIRFLLGHLLDGAIEDAGIHLDPELIGIVGHSFGGWTALAATATDRRIRAVVALAPAGSSNPRPGIIPVTLSFEWGRDVPTLYLVGENDVLTPLAGMYEVFERTRATKQMVILGRADHSHFADNVEEEHEQMRAMPFTGDLAWVAEEMRPIRELSTGAEAHLCVRGLTVAHMDAVLRGQEEARHLLAGDLEAELARRGVEVLAHKP